MTNTCYHERSTYVETGNTTTREAITDGSSDARIERAMAMADTISEIGSRMVMSGDSNLSHARQIMDAFYTGVQAVLTDDEWETLSNRIQAQVTQNAETLVEDFMAAFGLTDS